jgi:hypothetical protein
MVRKINYFILFYFFIINRRSGIGIYMHLSKDQNAIYKIRDRVFLVLSTVTDPDRIRLQVGQRIRIRKGSLKKKKRLFQGLGILSSITGLTVCF